MAGTSKHVLKVVTQLEGKLAKQLKGLGTDVDKFGKKADTALSRVGKQVKQLVSSRLGIAAIGAAFAVAAAKAIRFGISLDKAMISAASRAEESGAKFRAVFGSLSEANEQFVAQLGETAGRSQLELTEAMAGFQDTFVPLGFASDDAAKLSQAITKLGIDLASFNNSTDKEAFDALQSAIVGNHETVRRYGLILTESTLKAEAYTSGIAKVGEQLTEVQKVQARLSLITKGSKAAIGDAARTSGSYANVMKRLNGQLLDHKARIGKQLTDKILDLIVAYGGVDEVVKDIAGSLEFLADTSVKTASVMASSWQNIIATQAQWQSWTKGMREEMEAIDALGDKILKSRGIGQGPASKPGPIPGPGSGNPQPFTGPSSLGLGGTVTVTGQMLAQLKAIDAAANVALTTVGKLVGGVGMQGILIPPTTIDEGAAAMDRLKESTGSYGAIMATQVIPFMAKFGIALEKQKHDAQVLALKTEAGESVVSNFASAVVSAAQGSENAFHRMAEGIAADLLFMAARFQATKLIGSLFPGLGGAFGLVEKGAVFGQQGKVEAFARGGVVNSPTLFPHRGGSGIMGEAGPEAVMPLRRGQGGRLGVEVAGGGGRSLAVNVTINALDAPSVAQLLLANPGAIGSAVKDAFMQDRELRTLLQGGYA